MADECKLYKKHEKRGAIEVVESNITDAYWRDKKHILLKY